ncbi:hypothetical protein J6590_031252 [Homalodisca vitripennis]|nr:hypothetical protein J6590_031252 [Homalodisca vitripennis]
MIVPQHLERDRDRTTSFWQRYRSYHSMLETIMIVSQHPDRDGDRTTSFWQRLRSYHSTLETIMIVSQHPDRDAISVVPWHPDTEHWPARAPGSPCACARVCDRSQDNGHLRRAFFWRSILYTRARLISMRGPSILQHVTSLTTGPLTKDRDIVQGSFLRPWSPSECLGFVNWL